jgi:DNA-directed RNA polymerase specialized sigma24 family protein
MVAPSSTLAEALRSPELRAALPRLLVLAMRRRRHKAWTAGRDPVTDAADAEDLLQDAFLRCLETPPPDREGMTWEEILGRIMRNLASHSRKRAALRPDVVYLEEHTKELAAPSSRRAEVLGARRLLAAIREELQEEPELGALLGAIEAGIDKREDKAAALGCTPERVSLLRLKMNRRLAAVRLQNGDDDERQQELGPAGDAPAPRRVSR